MTESFNKDSIKSGLPPGSLVHVGDVLEATTTITVMHYNKSSVVSDTIESIDEALKYKDSDNVTWVILEGLTNVNIVERIGATMDIHHLVLEDILNTNQRPKFEEYSDYLYIVLKRLSVEDEAFNINYEQVSLLVFKNMVFLFKEQKDDLFQPLKQQITTGRGILRTLGSDFLTYNILDVIVDQNFILIDSLDEATTELEDRLISADLTKELLYKIQKLKREMINIKRYVTPVRELLAGMLHSKSALISDTTHIYLRDVSDHVLRVIESIESHRDILTGLLHIYTSSVSNKMNEVMKVLTIFTSVFTPLTFIAGVYGMNFEFMPELKWHWAYPALWGAFIVIPLVQIVYFKRKKWL